MLHVPVFQYFKLKDKGKGLPQQAEVAQGVPGRKGTGFSWCSALQGW